MKAAILDKYEKLGRDLIVSEIPVPEIKNDEVLVKVHTAGVNPLDNMIIRGEVKLIVPYTMPLVMGNEFCGTIEKIGDEARGFSVGDRVYGRLPLSHIGAFAEYVAVSCDAIAKVPEYLSDEEATAVPLTSLTALQALELLQVEAGDTVFIAGKDEDLIIGQFLTSLLDFFKYREIIVWAIDVCTADILCRCLGT